MARLLLDTHVLLWALSEPERLPTEIAARITNDNNDVLFSAASIWEIAIKLARGKPDFTADPAEVAGAAVAAGLRELPVTSAMAATVAALQNFHRDPFDRLLVAQAITEPARLLTADNVLGRYSELVEVFDLRR